MNKLLPILALLFFSCDGWTEEREKELRGDCYYKDRPEDCACVFDAIRSSISYSDYKNIKEGYHNMLSADAGSPKIVANAARSLSYSEGREIRDKVNKCCQCDSFMCEGIFLMTEIAIDESILYEDEKRFPEWCDE